MADIYVKKATGFIEKHKKEPFFLYFSTHDIHVPRLPHARFAGKSELGVRGDVIMEFDWCVGEIMSALDRFGLAENTLVIFSSDNGPVVDDGYKDGAREKLADHQPAGPLRGGKYSIFEGGTRVPFVVRWPGRIKPGISDALICQVDFPATFAALIGADFDAKTSPDSQNMLASLLGESVTGREQLVEHSGGIALRQGAWKYIPPRPGARRLAATNTEPGNDPSPQLYDLEKDLGETKNVAAELPDKVKELAALLAAERAKGNDATGQAGPQSRRGTP
jgi:arylsulfatase A-like enzyme